ncbi:MAG: hypothetical protein Q7U53_10350 [Anaerolineaceae bacterium]|nr:hypothetical protein [Anaerolineaceae bacterium]
MKSTGKVLLAPIVTILLVITLFYLVIKIHPYKPGDPFFKYQNAVEYSWAKFILSPEKRVEVYFDLVEHRLKDLASLDRMDYVRPTIEAFDQAVSKAIQSIQLLDWDNAVIYYHNVQPLMRRVEIVIEDLSDRMYHQDLAILQHKAEYLKTAKTSTEIIKTGATQYSSFHVSEPESPEIMVKEEFVDIKPKEISFETQKRSNCMNCHQDGLYMDPDSRCSNCHLRETYFMVKLGTDGYRPVKFAEKYPFHFVGDCSNCHTTKSWMIEAFEHPYAYSCIICHENNIPELDQKPLDQIFLTGSGRKINTNDTSHYPLDCIHCHKNTSSWSDYSYDHQQDTCSRCHDKDERFIRYTLNGIRCNREQNCQNCHTYDRHKANYGETCYECHQNVNNWLDVSINHEKFTSCRSCHDSDKPDTHQYKSDCNVCHSTVDWKKMLFDHSSTSNCISCHTAPGDHLSKGYTDQCSTCHSIYIWEKALFHQVMSNCTNCHTSPENHYPALCTSCHDTNNWKNISVNHTELSACTNCHSVPVNHYPAACISCHNTSSWITISVNHTGLTACSSCHTAPSNHYPGNCQTCHNTNSWEPQNYHNDSTTACGNCHSAPAIHYPLACEVCHKTTTSWNAVYDHSVTSLACSTCHLRPADHWIGECSNCHVTSFWDQVDFDHSGYTDCKSCHTSPQGHPGAQCSRCHTTDTWEVP